MIICSALGIFVFFISIPIGDSRRIPVDHLLFWIKGFLREYYIYIIILLALLAAVFGIRDRVKKGSGGILFPIQAVIGLIISTLPLFGFLPEGIVSASQSAINATGDILCAIFLTAVFTPLLTEYGFVDFMGVIVRPVMRKLFHTPGSSAVIGVSAFLGNYSVGHIVSKQMYDEGRFTEKESVIVALGFSTCSIGLMLNLANFLGISEHWPLYLITVVFITLIATALTARIFPISKKSDSYKEGVEPVEEPAVRENILKTAYITGCKRAENALGFFGAVKRIITRMFPVMCEITGTSIFVIFIGTLISRHASVADIISLPARGLLTVLGVPAADVVLAARALMLGLLEPALAGIVSEGMFTSVFSKWMTAVVPYAEIIFFAGFVPSLVKSGINCKVGEMLLIWVERIVIAAVLTALLVRLYILAGII